MEDSFALTAQLQADLMKLVNFEKGGTYLFDQQNLASAHAECEA